MSQLDFLARFATETQRLATPAHVRMRAKSLAYMPGLLVRFRCAWSRPGGRGRMVVDGVSRASLADE